jgi:hypothetical protein
MPFERAAREMHAILGIHISDATVRRQTLQVGAAFEQIQTEQSHPQRGHVRFPLPEGKPVDRLAMGSDGGMVPLTGGRWAEVKTLVIGEVLTPQPSTHATPQARTTAHSYFSRMTDAHTFADLASAEITRRGVAKAHAVCAVQDGAEWLQGFVDGHRHDAVRILDFAHAAEYVGRIAEQATLGGYHLTRFWLPVILHQLKHHGPDRVIMHLERLERRWPLPTIGEALRYFHKRRTQMNYPQFQAQGWPIGSGMVESANKVVMQARLKGAGMHWEPTNVNPMLAVRGVICNDRWKEMWQQQQRWRRDTRQARRHQRTQQKRARLLHQLKEQILRLSILLPRSMPVDHPPAPKGRTESQKRWGRVTFSRKALPETIAKK